VGGYRKPGEVLDQASAIIREQLDLEDWMLERREAVAAHIEMGFAHAGARNWLTGILRLRCCGRRRAGRLQPQA